MRKASGGKEERRGKANNRVFAGISLPIYSRINTKLSFHDDAIKAVLDGSKQEEGIEIKDDDDFCLPLYALIIVSFYEHNFSFPMSLLFFCERKLSSLIFLFRNEWMAFMMVFLFHRECREHFDEAFSSKRSFKYFSFLFRDQIRFYVINSKISSYLTELLEVTFDVF